VRFVMEHQPPIVEAEFLDSEGRRQTFVDKVAIFTSDWPDADSHYPQFGVIRCNVLERCPSPDDRVRIKTEVESTDGCDEFVVLAGQFCPPLSPLKTVAENPGCDGCPMQLMFSHNHFVPPQEPNPGHNLMRLVIAEAPGENEARVGLPLVGDAGKFFDGLLVDAGVPRDGLTITNCLSCHPPHNIFPTAWEAWSPKSKRRYISKEDGVKAVQHCKEKHVDPLLQSRKWNRVDLVGGQALQIVAQKKGITKWKGRPLILPSGHKAIAILHPSHLKKPYLMERESRRKETVDHLKKGPSRPILRSLSFALRA